MEKKPKNIFVQGAISPQFIATSVEKHSHNTQIGAHSIFLGQVRADMIESQQVIGIDYSCYEEMALQKAFDIREECFAKYELTCMHIYHSLGVVKTGEISLFVFTSSKHRRAAMEACDYLVERIKKELPVWGKEILENEQTVWKENR